MANDYTSLVAEVIYNQMDVLRNSFVLVSRIFNHGRVRGSAVWDKYSAIAVETKTQGTALSAPAASSTDKVTLTPGTHKVVRWSVEDGEASIIRKRVRELANARVPRGIKSLVNTIESEVAALQSSVSTNRIGTLGGGINKTLMARAVKLLELQDATAETLAVHPAIKEAMKLDDGIQKFLEMRNDGRTGNFVLNVFDFQALGQTSQIYSPTDGQYVNLAFQREWAGIAFGDMSGADPGPARYISVVNDDRTGIQFRVIQGNSSDHLGTEFVLDVQYDVAVQEEQLCVAIQS